MEFTRGRSVRRDGWRYLEVVEGEPLTGEQRETLEHNKAVEGNSVGFHFIELPKLKII